MWCVLLASLLSSIGAHAADTKKPSAVQPVSAVADTQAGARRQGAVNVGGIIWACSGTHCSASPMPSAVAAPVMVCQGLAREVGAIRNFTAANRPLNGNELQQCNSVVPAAAAMPGMKPPAGFAPTPAPVTGFAAPSPLAPGPTKKPSAIPQTPAKSGGGFGPQVATTPTTPDAEKKPSGAKGTAQASAQGDGKAAPPPQPPSPAGTAAPSAPGSRSYPVGIRTEGMTVTGTGRLMDRMAYTRKDIRTDAMTVTGTGHVTVNLPFTPKNIRTDGMTVTGTGSVR